MNRLVNIALAIFACVVILGVPLGFALGPPGDTSTKVEAVATKPNAAVTDDAPCVMPAVYIIAHPNIQFMQSRFVDIDRPFVDQPALFAGTVTARGPPDYPLRS